MRLTIFCLLSFCCCERPTTDFVIENQTNYNLEIRGYDTFRDEADTLNIEPNGTFRLAFPFRSSKRTYFIDLSVGPDSVRVEFNNSKYILLECYEDFSDCSFEKCDVCISNLVYGSPSEVVIITEDHYDSAIPF